MFSILAAATFLASFGCGGGGGGEEPRDPTVTSTVPADGATDVLLDSDISITFSEAMNKTSVMDSLVISPPITPYASTWSGSTLTLDPASDMTDSTTYTVTIGASVQDAEGATMGSPYTFDFTTDEIPTVISTTPIDTSTGISVDTDITITFSEAMNSTSVMDSLLISPDPGSYAGTWSGTTLTINPDSALSQFTTYTVTVGGSTLDAEGTAMETGDSFSFRTGDDDVPTVTSTVPSDNDTNVSLGVNVQVTFSEAMNTSTVQSNVTVSPDPGTELFNWFLGDTQLVLSYGVALQEDQLYTVTIGAFARDAEGTLLGTPYSFDFTTEDIPTVTSTSPIDATTDVPVSSDISITFSEAMDEASVQSNLTINPNPGSVGYSWAGTTLTVNPTSDLSQDTQYTVTVGASSEDAEGSAMGLSFPFSFTTEEFPTVISTTPTDNATGVLLDTDITITFSEAMNKASVTDSLSISPPIGSYASTWVGNILVVDPDSALAASTIYTVTVGGSVEDAEGSSMGTPYTFDFTTGTFASPVVVSTIPANGDTAVATTTDITITFSTDMNQSVTEDAISISGYSGTMTFSWSLGSDEVVISLSPDLASDTPYNVGVAAYAEDASGTPMGTSYNFTFSTGGVITGALVSGTVLDDPESSHDDNLSGTYVVLMDGPPFDSNVDYLYNTDPSGTYQFDYVQNGSYYPAAMLDTNAEDGEPNPRYGDAIGEWSGGATALTVTGTDRTGIDIQLVDPEAISGNVFYTGVWSSYVYTDYPSTMELLQVYAWQSTTTLMYESEMTLTNSPFGSVAPTVATDYGNGQWVYGLNPYLQPELSVVGNFADGTVTQTGNEYIPPGNYQVLGLLEIPAYASTPDPGLMGFADNLAAIDDTGDDAGGINITLHDTIDEVKGETWVLSATGPEDEPYGSARVSLLGWPLWAVPTNEWVDTATPTSGWTYGFAPVGVPVAIHTEPDPADASSLMAMNEQYRMLNTTNAWPNDWFETRLMERATMDLLAATAGTSINPARAQIMGTVWAYAASISDYLRVPGVTVTISTGDQPLYIYSDLTFTAPYTQHDMDPQFAFLNVVPPPDEKAIITFSHPDSSIVIDSVTVPVRADEVTMFWQEELTDPGGVAAGITISGWIEDPETETPFGAGATVTLTWENGTVIDTTLTDVNSEFFFYNVPSMLPVYLTSSHTDTGYVPLSTAVFNAFENTFNWFPLVPENVALTLVNLLPGINEPAWNSTLQSINWFILQAIEAFGSDQLAGVTFSTDAPGAQIYYWDTAADMYTNVGPSRAYTTDEAGTQSMNYAPNSSSGLFTFNASGTLVDSVNGVLVPGEVLYWNFQQ